jgi:hypothetical protein
MLEAVARRDAEADLRALRVLSGAISGAMSEKGGAAFERLAKELEARAGGRPARPDRRAAARALAGAIAGCDARKRRSR